jgi:osmotically inducible protein OsmC
MKRTAHAVWTGALRDGKGFLTTASGALHDRPYSFKTRFEDETGKAGTNPEELIAAAHAGCFAMQLSHFLAEAGQPATKLSVDAEVTIGPAQGGGQAISKSALTLRGDVPGLSEAQFIELANKAKAGCPVSKALSAIEITLDAKLES